MRINRFVSGSLLALLLLSLNGLAAYETEWDDPKFKDPDATDGALKNSVFKMDGVIWAGYDFMDRSANGAPDTAGGDHTGFRVGRAYLNTRGKATNGPFKGWAYRVTTDVQRAEHLYNNCGSTGATVCSGNNDYIVFLKYAYIDIPLTRGGKTHLRLGQQQTPPVSGQAGVSLTEIWGHRYLDTAGKQVWDELGLSGSTANGFGFIHKSEYYGLHLLVGNGEGYHHANAENITVNSTSLSDFSAGDTTSYGYDIWGMLSFIPTGNNKALRWTINLPFRQRNFYGVDGSETETIQLTMTDASNNILLQPQYKIYHGDVRAKRDLYYGWDTDVEVKTGDFAFTVGGGSAIKLDRRGSAYVVDETLLNGGVSLADFQTLNTYFLRDEDRYGLANYVFFHFKYQMLGAFFRYTEGSSQSSLNGKLGTVNGKPWLVRVLNQDVLNDVDGQNGALGDMTLGELKAINPGKNRFRTVTYGGTWHANGRFRISLGVKETVGTDSNGDEFRENVLQRYYDTTGTTTVASQLESSDTLKSIIGYQPTDTLDLNDFIGKRSINREVFIRGQYKF